MMIKALTVIQKIRLHDFLVKLRSDHLIKLCVTIRTWEIICSIVNDY